MLIVEAVVHSGVKLIRSIFQHNTVHHKPLKDDHTFKDDHTSILLLLQ